jgi:hypothetical protein
MKSYPSGFSRLADDPGYCVGTDRTTALADEHERPTHGLPKFPQAGNLIAVERGCYPRYPSPAGRGRSLCLGCPGRTVTSGPAGLLGAYAMPVGKSKKHDIAHRFAATLAGGDDQSVRR